MKKTTHRAVAAVLFMLSFVWLFLLLSVLPATSSVPSASAKAQPRFGSPVNYEITLAGNFGEPRPNHFHGGVDIKTGGVEGKPIFSIGDGYVSAVSVGLYGFGNAVYVRHPEGYTSIYCHLKKFTPQIAILLRRAQYAARKAEGEFRFRPTDMPVAEGQLIAVSGNTGASTAPHLHLEIHDTRTWHMLDPLDFIGHHMLDTVPPQAHAFMAHPVEGAGVFNGSTQKQSFGFASHQLSRTFTAWGRVGFSLWANDYMQGVYNHYGIRRMEFFVDDRKVFASDVTDIPVGDNMQVNAWGDYDHYLRSHVWYMKSFVEPGMTLPIVHADSLHGLVDFNEARLYRLAYVLTDQKGNQSRYEFTVEGCPHPRVGTGNGSRPDEEWPFAGRRKSPVPANDMRWDRLNNVQLPGLQLLVRPRQLSKDVTLKPSVRHQPARFSDAYQLHDRSLQLFRYAPVAIRANKMVEDSSKLYVVGHWGVDKYMGGTYRDGFVWGELRELGATYELAYDDTPPTVHYLGITTSSFSGMPSSSHAATSALPSRRPSSVLRLSLSDSGSGISHYEAFVDGEFVLFEPVAKSNIVECRLALSPVRHTNALHTLHFTATDNRQNRREFSVEFVY